MTLGSSLGYDVNIYKLTRKTSDEWLKRKKKLNKTRFCSVLVDLDAIEMLQHDLSRSFMLQCGWILRIFLFRYKNCFIIWQISGKQKQTHVRKLIQSTVKVFMKMKGKEKITIVMHRIFSIHYREYTIFSYISSEILIFQRKYLYFLWIL